MKDSDWNAIIDNIHTYNSNSDDDLTSGCIPILGPDVTEPIIGSRSNLAYCMAKEYEFPGYVGDLPCDMAEKCGVLGYVNSKARVSFPQVAQYIKTTEKENALSRILAKCMYDEIVRHHEFLKKDVPKISGNNQKRWDLVNELIKLVWEHRKKQNPEGDIFSVLGRLPLPLYITADISNLLTIALRQGGKQPQVARWDNLPKTETEPVPAQSNHILELYEIGLCALGEKIRKQIPDHQSSFNAFNQRLKENISNSRLFGDDKDRSTGRSEIISEIDKLVSSLELGESFFDFCEASSKPYSPEWSSASPWVYYPFGSLSDSNSLRLAEDDYFDYLLNTNNQTSEFISQMTSRLLRNSLLFIGFRMDDWGFRVFLRRLLSENGCSLLREAGKPHVAVQIQPDKTEFRDQEKAKTYIERYIKSFGGQEQVCVYWGTVEEFSKQLSKRWEDSQ